MTSKYTATRETFYDYYNTRNGWYYVIQVLSHIYLIALVVAFPWVYKLYIVPHDACAQLPCGTLFSLRYVSLQWLLLAMACFKVLTVWILWTATLFRRYRGCSIMWMVFMLLAYGVELFALLGESAPLTNTRRSRDARLGAVLPDQ